MSLQNATKEANIESRTRFVIIIGEASNTNRAIIRLDFMPEPPEKHVPMITWGNLFRLSVTITDDRGKISEVSGYGYCAPHNAKKESKSAGAERF